MPTAPQTLTLCPSEGRLWITPPAFPSVLGPLFLSQSKDKKLCSSPTLLPLLRKLINYPGMKFLYKYTLVLSKLEFCHASFPRLNNRKDNPQGQAGATNLVQLQDTTEYPPHSNTCGLVDSYDVHQYQLLPQALTTSEHSFVSPHHLLAL